MDKIYDHYIAVDWSQRNMAIARMTAKSNKITVIDVPSDVKELKEYLSSLKGTKIIALEETTTTQWLYTELVDHVDRVFVCDPYRNKLLSEGAKTDKIDASKLVQLLRAGLMKEVYHSNDENVHLRRFMSGYNGLVRSGVRLQNQRHALFRAVGNNSIEHELERFVLESLDERIQRYEEDKRQYEIKLKGLAKRHKAIRDQQSMPGIGAINAVRLVARVISPHRFADKGHYLSYCGLVKLERISGGKSYGSKKPRCCRELKYVYKTAALAAIGGNNPLNDYYEYLVSERRYPDDQARHAVARRIAVLSLGVFKSGKRYQRRRYVRGKRG